jgi:hypothetical protein
MAEAEQDVTLELLRVEGQFKAGANWFFWIAGLSMVNSVIFLSGSEGGGFVVGLGITQLFDAIGAEISSETGNIGTIITTVLSVIVAGFFVLFGIFARKRFAWAFIVGMVLYALDGLLFLMVQDLFSMGFHALALYFIFGGLKAMGKLNQMELQLSDETQISPDSVSEQWPEDTQ